MSANDDICQLCHNEKFRYTCPKCSILYCSVACYKSPEHGKCSEQFYRNCIQEELSAAQPSSHEDMRKIYDILQRIHEADAGLTPDLSNDALNESLDSDDDAAEEVDTASPMDAGEEIEVEEEEEEDIATRLQDVDLNDADEVWQRLTDAERAEFQRMVECGQIMKLLPDYKPWWCKQKLSKIVELPADKAGVMVGSDMPAVKANIPTFSNICKKTPSPCLHYNLWNIMASYACMVRFFNGDHLTSPDEAVAHLVNLSLALKFGTNFEDADDAIISVEMEALTSGNGSASAATTKPAGVTTHLVGSREQLQSDARQLMSSLHNKLAALSDILELLQLAKKRIKHGKSEQADFHKLFAMCSGSVELDCAKLKHLIKKIEFLLSYVNKVDENILK